MLGRTNAGGGGGGGGLNFQVIGGTTAPNNPKENMIWVNTDIKITSWFFSVSVPETTETGSVWIPIGTESEFEFNALKKNGIQVYPISVAIYTDGAWMDAIAYIRKGGEWKQFSWDIYYLFNYRDYTNITGGFVCENKNAISGTNAGKPTITTNEDGSWTIDAASMQGGIVRTVNKIDVNGFTKLCFRGSIGETNNYCKLVIWKDVSSNGYSGMVANVSKATNGYAEINVSNLNDGPYYVGFSIYHNFGNITMERLWLE